MKKWMIIMGASLMLFIYGCGNADVESAMYSRMDGKTSCKCGDTHEISKVTSKHGTVKDAWYVTIEWRCERVGCYFCETDEVMFKKGKITVIKYAHDQINPHERPWWVLGVGFGLVGLIGFILGMESKSKDQSPDQFPVNVFYRKIERMLPSPDKLKLKFITKFLVYGIPVALLAWLTYYFIWALILDLLIAKGWAILFLCFLLLVMCSLVGPLWLHVVRMLLPKGGEQQGPSGPSPRSAS